MHARLDVEIAFDSYMCYSANMWRSSRPPEQTPRAQPSPPSNEPQPETTTSQSALREGPTSWPSGFLTSVCEGPSPQARPLISDNFGRASSMIPADKRGNPAAHGVDGDGCGGAQIKVHDGARPEAVGGTTA